MSTVPPIPKFLPKLIAIAFGFFVALRSWWTWLLIAVVALIYMRAKGYTLWSSAQWSTWLESPQAPAIAGLAGSALTVVGFFIAFYVARASWVRDARTRLRLEAATDFEGCLRRLSQGMGDLASVIESFTEVARKMAQGDTAYVDHNAEWAKIRTDKAWATRTEIIAGVQELEHLRRKHDIVIASQLGGSASMKYASHVASNVVARFQFELPSSQHTPPLAFIGKLSALDIAWWTDYRQLLVEAATNLSNLAYMVRSAAITDVFGMNVWRLLNVSKEASSGPPA